MASTFFRVTAGVVSIFCTCMILPSSAGAQILIPSQVVRESGYGNDGLNGVTSVAVSADGAHLYAVSSIDNAIAAFGKDAGTGALSYIEVERHGVQGVLGMREPTSVAIAPDGNHVYVTARFEGTVAVFSRNSGTGALTFVEFIQDYHATVNPSGIEGLRGARSVVVSPDNAHVYVVGTDEDAIVVFSRNLATGALTHASTVFDGVNGVTGLNVVQDIALSQGGTNLYAVSDFDDTVVTFSRNTTTGALTFVQQQKNGQLGVTGLDGAMAVTVVGSHVYVASRVDDAVALFTRVGGGALSFVNSYKDGVGGVDGVDGARDVMVAPNGTHVYVTGTDESAVAVFTRNTSTGVLTFASVARDNTAGVDHMAQPSALAIAPDNAHVYVTSPTENAITGFSRNLGTGALTLIDAYLDAIGLQFPLAAAMAPDGLDLYVTDAVDNSVSQFERQPVDGTLTYGGSLKDDIGGVDGLNSVLGIAVSPDNKHVYTTGRFDDAVTVFARNASTGALTFVETHKDDSQGGVINGLDGATAVVVSPDGKFVYVGSGFDSAIVVFTRNATTGALSFVQMAQYGTDGVLGTALLSAMALSPDGAHLYAVGTFHDTIAVFSRDALTGHVTFLQVLTDGVDGVDGLADPLGVAVAPDGKHVYVVANADDAASIFARNGTTGLLTYQGLVKDNVSGVTTLDGARGIAVSADGRRVYIASEADHALSVFHRSAASGILTFLEAHVHGVAGIDGLAGASFVAESPEGKHLYVTGTVTSSLAVFERSDDDLIPEHGLPVGGATAAGALLAATSLIAIRAFRRRSP